MLPDAIELVVVTPERQLLREKTMEVQLPGEGGHLGVLPGHAPLITELGIGELSYHDLSGKESAHLAIVRDLPRFLSDRVTVLAETAERAEEIDLQRAKDALARAEAAPGLERSQYRLGPCKHCAPARFDPHPGCNQAAQRSRCGLLKQPCRFSHGASCDFAPPPASNR